MIVDMRSVERPRSSLLAMEETSESGRTGICVGFAGGLVVVEPCRDCESELRRATPPMKPLFSVSAGPECLERRLSLLNSDLIPLDSDFGDVGEVGEVGDVSSAVRVASSSPAAPVPEIVPVVMTFAGLGASRDLRFSSLAIFFSSASFSFLASFSCLAAALSSASLAF